MAKAYVITGGAGFIGCNLARELVTRGEHVTIIDNFATGKKANLDDIASKINLVEGSITDLSFLQRAFKGADYVLHQAALPSVPRSIDSPLASNETNIDGTLNVLVAARDQKIKRVVYAASSSAYGNADVAIKTEDLRPSPLSPYALTKYVGEEYCRLFYKLYGLETIALRYFNVFGPYQNPEGGYAAVIPKFIATMLKGDQPVIYGDGNQSRDFTYVANNVEANILAATATKGAGDVINIACGNNVTLNELVDLINQELGTTIKPKYQNERAGDVRHSRAGINKAHKLINYQPRVSFQDGLKETIKWYKTHLQK